jgi:cytochrome c
MLSLRNSRMRFRRSADIVAAFAALALVMTALTLEILDRRRPGQRHESIRGGVATALPVGRRRWPFIAAAVVGLALVVGVVADKVEAEQRWAAAVALTAGDPAAAPAAIRRYGCAGCHVIPGVAAGRGLVGPPLQGLKERVYIAGVLPNSASNLVRWIVDPPAIDPQTAMPVSGISEAEARDVAAYLYALP